MGFSIYADGSCIGNPGSGGWSAVIIDGATREQLSGCANYTTNNRTEISAVIGGLREIGTTRSEITIYTDSMYVVGTMTQGWKRKANRDLWDILDELSKEHNVKWEYLKAHTGHPEGELVDRSAREEARGFMKKR